MHPLSQFSRLSPRTRRRFLAAPTRGAQWPVDRKRQCCRRGDLVGSSDVVLGVRPRLHRRGRRPDPTKDRQVWTNGRCKRSTIPISATGGVEGGRDTVDCELPDAPDSDRLQPLHEACTQLQHEHQVFLAEHSPRSANRSLALVGKFRIARSASAARAAASYAIAAAVSDVHAPRYDGPFGRRCARPHEPPFALGPHPGARRRPVPP